MAGYYAELNVFLGESPSGSPKVNKTPKVKKEKEKKDKIKTLSTKIGGFLTATAGYANSKIGAYTGNKLRQSNTAQGLALSSMAVYAAINPVVGSLALASYTVKSIIDQQIREINSQQESEYRMSYKGQMTTSGSRWKGGKL